MSILIALTLTILAFPLHVGAQTAPSGSHIHRDGSFMQGIYDPRVASVQFHQTDKEISHPVLVMGQPPGLELRFDLLSARQIPLWVTLVHCDASWRPSRLAYNEYLPGFESVRINDYTSSFNTRIPYVHYRFSFPNSEMAPKLSGNYLLLVYERNQNQPLLTRRLAVAEQIIEIEAEVGMPSLPTLRDKAQQINVVVRHPSLSFSNPQQEVVLCILRNNRWDQAHTERRPAFVRPGELDYRGTPGILFPGGNEYRHFTTRNLISPLGMEHFDPTGEHPQYVLTTDIPRVSETYSFSEDINGLYVIRADQRSNPDSEAEYVEVHFSAIPVAGTSPTPVFVSGAFNDFNASGQGLMSYNNQTGKYTYTAFVKQGFYDYQYVLEGEGKMHANTVPESFEGDFFETENEYFIYVYYRKPGARYDRIIGFRKIGNMSQGASYQASGSILKDLFSR